MILIKGFKLGWKVPKRGQAYLGKRSQFPVFIIFCIKIAGKARPYQVRKNQASHKQCDQYFLFSYSVR